MILHGHQHQSFLATFHLTTQIGGPLLVAGAPSAAAKDLPPQGRNGYHVIQLDGRNITVSVREFTEERRFSEARRVQFVREAGGTYATNAIPSARSHREPTVTEVRALTRNTAQAIKRVVTEAYGPSGGLRLIVDMSGISHVRDGEKVAGSLKVEDPIQNRMLGVVRNLAQEVASEAGDGRKTAMLLWAELVSLGLEVAMRPLIEALHCLIKTERPILIFARKFDEESLAMLEINARRKTISCIPFACGGLRHDGTLLDLSLLSGARIFNPRYDDDISTISLNDIGNAKSIAINRDEILVVPSADLSKDRLMETVELLRSRRDNSASPYEKDLFQLRLARLVGSYVTVNAIGISDQEAKMFESEFQDAYHAANGATVEGVLPGAGRGFAHIADALLTDAGLVPDIGTKLLVQALQLPAQLLTSVSGKNEVLDSAKGIRLGLTLATEAAIRTLRTRTVDVSAPWFQARVADEDEDEDEDDVGDED